MAGFVLSIVGTSLNALVWILVLVLVIGLSVDAGF